MHPFEFSKIVDEKWPAVAKEIENIIILEQDADNQIIKLKCLLLMAIAAERKKKK